MRDNGNNRGMSRRGFLEFGAVAALAAGAGLAGCGRSEGNASQVDDIKWNKEADAIICGFGAAGVAAAIEITKAGGSAIILEGSGAAGGATRLSGALVYMGGGTRLQKACGVEDSVENMKAYVSAVTKPVGGDQKLLDIYCNNSVALFDWLEANGVKFDEAADIDGYNVVAPNGISLEYSGNERGWEYAKVAKPAPRGHTPHHDDKTSGGAALFDPLKAAAEKGGTEVLYNAMATELIQDSTGKVIGVYATVNDEVTAFKANKAVVLTTGAFTLNRDMLADFCPEGLIANPTAAPTDMGTGIKMGMKIGAGLRGMGQASMQRFIYMFGTGPTSGILVDKRGVRIVDEGAYGNWAGRAIYELTPEAAYLIMDNDMANDLNPMFGKYMTLVAEEDTIEALAGAIGLEAKTLTASVRRYNELAASGSDDDFHKNPKFLKQIATPPFHAADVSASQCSNHTLGGLKINENSQVLDTEGEVIAGLYSAGRNACAIFGNYPGSGNSIAEGLIFGRIAGQHIASL
ncbi:MAG: FAD-dependent oxidoreductase [Coriobacteriia bacterium]